MPNFNIPYTMEELQALVCEQCTHLCEIITSLGAQTQIDFSDELNKTQQIMREITPKNNRQSTVTIAAAGGATDEPEQLTPQNMVLYRNEVESTITAVFNKVDGASLSDADEILLHIQDIVLIEVNLSANLRLTDWESAYDILKETAISNLKSHSDMLVSLRADPVAQLRIAEFESHLKQYQDDIATLNDAGPCDHLTYAGALYRLAYLVSTYNAMMLHQMVFPAENLVTDDNREHIQATLRGRARTDYKSARRREEGGKPLTDDDLDSEFDRKFEGVFEGLSDLDLGMSYLAGMRSETPSADVKRPNDGIVQSKLNRTQTEVVERVGRLFDQHARISPDKLVDDFMPAEAAQLQFINMSIAALVQSLGPSVQAQYLYQVLCKTPSHYTAYKRLMSATDSKFAYQVRAGLPKITQENEHQLRQLGLIIAKLNAKIESVQIQIQLQARVADEQGDLLRAIRKAHQGIFKLRTKAFSLFVPLCPSAISLQTCETALGYKTTCSKGWAFFKTKLERQGLSAAEVAHDSPETSDSEDTVATDEIMSSPRS